MKKIGHLWRHHRIGLLAFCLAVAVTLFFVLRLIVQTLHWIDADNRFQPPAPWMTPRYIALSWDVPPSEIGAALQADAVTSGRPTLEAIAKARGVPVAQVLDEAAAYLQTRTPGQ